MFLRCINRQMAASAARFNCIGIRFGSTFFAKSHEYLTVDDKIGTVGITEHAQKELGDVVFVDIPDVGTKVEAGQPLLSVESVKAVAEVYSPVTGTVVEINKEVEGDPHSVNTDPEGSGWMVKIEFDSKSDVLMDADQYKEYLKTLE
eukprot:Platyproteum_vivax@DN1380_c0_g1_i2.p1